MCATLQIRICVYTYYTNRMYSFHVVVSCFMHSYGTALAMDYESQMLLEEIDRIRYVSACLLAYPITWV